MPLPPDSTRPLELALVATLALATGATLMYASPAAAQQDVQKAREAFKEGKRLYEQGDYEKAAEQFKEAYRYSDRSELLYNIGQAHRKSGKLKKAEEYFQKYLDQNPEASNRQEVLDKVVEIQQKLAAQMGSVQVSSSPEGADVFVDEESKSRCSTPCTVSLEPGSHEIRAASGGSTLGTETVEVEKGSTTSIAMGGQSRGPPGRLHIRTDSGGGSVKVAGAGESSLPMSEPMEVPSGTHELTVTGSSGETWSGDVTVEAGETKRLFVTTGTKTSNGASGGASAKRSLAYGLTGASLALIGGGLLLGKHAKTTHDILSNQQSRRGAVDQRLLKKGRREQLTANILLGAGAATFLSGVGLFTWDLLGSGG